MCKPGGAGAERDIGESTHSHHVVVIGAGMSGLAALKQVREAGFDAVAFDQRSEIGGHWSTAYEGVHIQTNYHHGGRYEFPDYPMPAELVPADGWVSGDAVQEYARRYVQHNGLMSFIHLRHDVRCSFRTSDGDWIVEVADGDGFVSRHSCKVLIAATGPFSAPKMPLWNTSDFNGNVIHSSQLKSAHSMHGKHVVIVGMSKSSTDLANLIADKADATTMIFREATWMLPSNVFWYLPFDIIHPARFLGLLSSITFGDNLPFWPHHALRFVLNFLLLWPLRWLMWRCVEWAIRAQLRLPQHLIPNQPMEYAMYCGTGMHSESFYAKVASGAVSAIQGEIKHLQKDLVVLNDGKTLRADVIVCATGYQYSFPFFDAETCRALEVESSEGVFLYRGICHPKVPNLFFVGIGCNHANNAVSVALQSLWVTRAIKDAAFLPQTSIMEIEIRSRRQEVVNDLRVAEGGHMPADAVLRKLGHKLSMYAGCRGMGQLYWDELLFDLGHAPLRRGGNLIAEMFIGLRASNYAKLFDSHGKDASDDSEVQVSLMAGMTGLVLLAILICLPALLIISAPLLCLASALRTPRALADSSDQTCAQP